MKPERHLRAGAAAALLLPLASCFEPPIREAIDLVFDANGAVDAYVVTRVEPERDYERNPAARRRITELKDSARCGEDVWTRQLERLSPQGFRRALSHVDGDLSEVSLAARFAEARSLEHLFDSYPISVAAWRRENVLQLEITPGSGGRATASEKPEAMAALARFSEAGARYLSALAELWRYLDGVPDREREVAGFLLGEETERRFEPVDDREENLLKELDEAMGGVQEFLRLADGRGESLDDLSRRVWDPFPARLAVEVVGRVEEATGFSREGEKRFLVPVVSLQGALAQLAGRWVAPDPLPVLLAAAERRDARPDVDAFLANPRVSRRPPNAAELRDALERAMAPQPVYRLRWLLPRG